MADSSRSGCWEGIEVTSRMDQANLFHSPRPPLVTIASGKGGVGKTFLAINLALALRDLGHRCLLVDLDWGLANVDVALGLAPALHVGHVIAGDCSVEEALIDYNGLSILANGCGDEGLAHLRGTSTECAHAR